VLDRLGKLAFGGAGRGLIRLGAGDDIDGKPAGSGEPRRWVRAASASATMP